MSVGDDRPEPYQLHGQHPLGHLRSGRRHPWRIVREVEAGAAADEEARRDAERKHQEFLAGRRRQQEEQHRQWRAVLEEARPKAVQDLRDKAFRNAYEAWAAANEIRAFCDALAGGACPDDDPDARNNRAQWVSRRRAMADRIDPTHGDTGLAAVPFDITTGPDDLRPDIGDWSPHQPRHEYRYERDQHHRTDNSPPADTWHPGLCGRPTWWRRT